MVPLYLVLLFIFVAAAVDSNAVHMEKMIYRENFVKQSRSPSDYQHEVVFALHQNNLDVLESMVLDRATPGSSLYQKWMTFDEVGELIKNPDALTALTTWLSAHPSVKITWTAIRGEYVKATAPISTWESLFSTEFYLWEDSMMGQDSVSQYHRCEHYSLPASLTAHVDAVFHTSQAPPIISKHFVRKLNSNIPTPEHLKDQKHNQAYKTTMFVPPEAHKLLRAGDSSSMAVMEALMASVSGRTSSDKIDVVKKTHDSRGDSHTIQASAVTVAFLDSFYHVPQNNGSASQSQSVFETSSESFSQGDLTQFQTKYNLRIQAAENIGNFEITSCTTDTCGEGNLDIQYIMGMSQYTTSIYWYVGGGDPFVSWVTDMAGEPNPPLSNSMSWGSIEQYNTASQMNSFNTEAKKLAAVGVTIAVSSGDNGVINYGCPCSSQYTVSFFNCACQASSSSSASSWAGTNTWTGTGYFPSFPATSPYVTAVGATMGTSSIVPNVGGAERTCMSQYGGIITSGGGFSTFYPQPVWQTAAVDAYFNSLATQPAPGFNRYGRGIPDVSLLGVDYQVVVGGSTYGFYGTSCSAPVLAAFVSLLNAVRAQQGIASIGFMNPSLYNSSMTYLFNDVTSGNNNYCSSQSASSAFQCASGFNAAIGWDPTTGWGSIAYPQLASVTGFSDGHVYDDDYTPEKNSAALSSTAVAIIVIVLVIVSIVVGLLIVFRRQLFFSSNRQQAAPGVAMNSPAPPQVYATQPQYASNPVYYNNQQYPVVAASAVTRN